MTVKEYERRERHICGDPSAECDMDCVHAGWQAIEIRKLKLRAEEAEAKLAAIKKLTQMFDGAVPTWRLREALADPPRTSAPTTGETNHD